MSKRSCGDCTKCCEGYLEGKALGHSFYRGKPCHFLAIGKGCTVYAKRPKEPCQTYKCAWLIDENIPEWMKPSEVNAIIDYSQTKSGIPYVRVNEAGSVLSSKVLTWVIQFCLSNNLNVYWTVDGGHNWFGTPEFCASIEADTTNKFAHQVPSPHPQVSEE